MLAHVFAECTFARLLLATGRFREAAERVRVASALAATAQSASGEIAAGCAAALVAVFNGRPEEGLARGKQALSEARSVPRVLRETLLAMVSAHEQAGNPAQALALHRELTQLITTAQLEAMLQHQAFQLPPAPATNLRAEPWDELVDAFHRALNRGTLMNSRGDQSVTDRDASTAVDWPSFHDDGAVPRTACVFVFGSNTRGLHGAAAARVAADRFGAVLGVGEGRTGDAYAIPTKDDQLRPRTLEAIEASVKTFLRYAAEHPEQRFFVTAVGTGLAGFKAHQIAPMFKHAPLNCSLPRPWLAFVLK